MTVTNDDILTEIRTMNSAIVEVQTANILNASRLRDLEDCTAKLHQTLYGNGQEGIKTTLALIKNNQTEIQVELESSNDRRAKREWTLIVIGIGLIVDTLVKLIPALL